MGDELTEVKNLTVRTNSIRLVKSLGDASPIPIRASMKSKVLLAKLPPKAASSAPSREEKFEEPINIEKKDEESAVVEKRRSVELSKRLSLTLSAVATSLLPQSLEKKDSDTATTSDISQDDIKLTDDNEEKKDDDKAEEIGLETVRENSKEVSIDTSNSGAQKEEISSKSTNEVQKEVSAQIPSSPRAVLIKRNSSREANADSMSEVSDADEETPIFATHDAQPRPAGGTTAILGQGGTATAGRSVGTQVGRPAAVKAVLVTGPPPPVSRPVSAKSIRWAPDNELVVETHAKTQYQMQADALKWKRRWQMLLSCIKRESPEDF